MNSFAGVLFFASVTFAFPQSYQFYKSGHPHPGHPENHATPHHVTPHHVTPHHPQSGYGRYGYGNEHDYNPRPLSHFRYADNPYRHPQVAPHTPVVPPARAHAQVAPHTPARAAAPTPTFNAAPTLDTAFGSFPAQGITPEQRALYLPVMRAVLKVMETNQPASQDINTLMVLTRDLNNRVPKEQNILGNFGNFGINNLESMGLPATGDIIVDVDGVPHIRTEFGTFPLSDTSLMTDQERAQFLPAVRTFTNVLEKGSADPNESQLLLQQAEELTKFIPGNLRDSIEGLTGGITNGFF